MPLTADLERLEELISGLNYAVMLEVHDVSHSPSDAQADLVRKCIPDAEPVNFTPVDAGQLIANFTQCVRYPGTTGHGPDKGTFVQPAFIELFAAVESQLREMCSAATPHSFAFRFGRPYHPIFWDFSFLIYGSDRSSVLVGASWD